MLEHGSEQVLRLPGSGYEGSEVQAHRTVPDPRESVGRWRQEADDEFRSISAEAFGDALREFGYDA